MGSELQHVPSSGSGKNQVSHHDASAPAFSGEGTLKRNIGPIGIIGLGLSIVNGWVAMNSTMVVGLGQGGSPVILYGLIGTSLINAFLITSIAELAASWPSAGGQYVWSAILSGALEDKDADHEELPGHKQNNYPLSFATGWATMFEWTVIVAAVSIIASQAVWELVSLYHPDFVIERWQVFLIFELVNTNSMVLNIFAISKMPNVGTYFLVLSNAMFIVLIIVCPATARTHLSSKFVWTQWQNETGWTSKYVVAATGLVNPGFLWSGVDGAVHIAEECVNAARTVPIALFASIPLGFVTGLASTTALLYSVQDFDAAASAELPFLAIIAQATRSNVAAVILGVAFLIVIQIMTNTIQMASSRTIWSFARDNGLPFSKRLSHVSPTLRVPVLPIVLSWAVVTVLGLLYIASTTVYNSIISCCIILQNVAISIVCVQLMLKGRRMNPNRWLKLGAFGWFCNIITVVWTIWSTVMWCFPLTPHPTGSEMNYSVAVLGVIALLGVLDWFLYARKHFHGPSKATLDAVEAENRLYQPGTDSVVRTSTTKE